MSREHLDVWDFTEAALNLYVPVTPHLLEEKDWAWRANCLREEVAEFEEACRQENLAEAGDALIDMTYFAHGTALLMGLPWNKMWDEVHLANMKKRRGNKNRGSDMDAVKPNGWVAPDHTKHIGKGPWPVRRVA